MVDFNSDNMLGTNRSHILDLIILGRRDEWLNTYQKYQVSLLDNKSGSQELFNLLKGILLTLAFELKETIIRHHDRAFYDGLVSRVRNSVSDVDIVDAFDSLNALLDVLNMTRVDTRKKIDTTNIELENEVKGI